MTEIAAEPVPWNATERSRAQTRALLTALSRDRRKRSRRSIAVNVLLGIGTVGTTSLVQIVRRFDRGRRLEWSQRLEYADWVQSFAPAQLSTAGLVYAPRLALERPSPLSGRIVFAASLFCGLSLLSRLHAATTTRPVVFAWDGELGDWISAIFLLVGVCWTGLLEAIWVDWRSRQHWLGLLNEVLDLDHRRIIRANNSRAVAWLLAAPCAASLVIQGKTGFPFFLIPMALVSSFELSILGDARRVHLHLIERLLEWMDDTGLPVEYDVTALSPDEIAAMMR